MKGSSYQSSFNSQLKDMETRLNSLLQTQHYQSSPSKVRLQQDKYKQLSDSTYEVKKEQIHNSKDIYQRFCSRFQNPSTPISRNTPQKFNISQYEKQKNSLLTFSENRSRSVSRGQNSITTPKKPEFESKEFSKEFKEIKEVQQRREINPSFTLRESTQFKAARISSQLEQQLPIQKLVELNHLVSMNAQEFQEMPQMQDFTQIYRKVSQVCVVNPEKDSLTQFIYNDYTQNQVFQQKCTLALILIKQLIKALQIAANISFNIFPLYQCLFSFLIAFALVVESQFKK